MCAREELLFTQPSAKLLAFFANNSTHCGIMADAHWHGAWEILFIRRGWGKQRINTSTFDFRMGDVIVIRSGDIHATDALCPQGCDIDVLHFTKEIFPSSVSDELPASGIIHSGETESEAVFNALKQHANTVCVGSDMLKTGLVQVLIGLIQQNAAPQQPRYSALAQRVCQLTERESNLRLAHIASLVGYSPEHLSRTFHAETGIPYRTYCDRIRMRRAADLLHQNISLAQIAESLGYSDESSFIRAFRLMYGITPGAYRRLCRPLSK
jgi:AraC-like DNA-binding protein